MLRLVANAIRIFSLQVSRPCTRGNLRESHRRGNVAAFGDNLAHYR